MSAPPLPLSAPSIGGNAWKYVKECLDTGWVSSVGRFVSDFERGLERLTGSPRAVACVNGTAALHTALHLLGVGRGDAVLVPAITFIATANAVAYTGAECVFIDCEPRRFNMDFSLAEEFLERRCVRRRGGMFLKSSGRRVRALLPVHILGYPFDLDEAKALARRWGLKLLEDAAESLGSTWRGRHCGTAGDFGALSFNGNKLVTTGGGGALLCSDARLAQKAKHVTQQAKSDPFEYEHDQIGWNYRLTNVLAALGVSQLELLPRFLEKRRRIAGWYRAELPTLRVEPDNDGAVWNRWLLGVQSPDPREKTRLLKALEAAGAQARPLWIPVPLQKAFRACASTPIPQARKAYGSMINIPSSTGLDQAAVRRVAAVLRRAELVRGLL